MSLNSSKVSVKGVKKSQTVNSLLHEHGLVSPKVVSRKREAEPQVLINKSDKVMGKELQGPLGLCT